MVFQITFLMVELGMKSKIEIIFKERKA